MQSLHNGALPLVKLWRLLWMRQVAVGAGISIGTMARKEIDALPAANLWMTHTSWSSRGLNVLGFLRFWKVERCRGFLWRGGTWSAQIGAHIWIGWATQIHGDPCLHLLGEIVHIALHTILCFKGFLLYQWHILALWWQTTGTFRLGCSKIYIVSINKAWCCTWRLWFQHKCASIGSFIIN